MHYTGTVYRNPYKPRSPLLEITQGCSHNRCKFCNMYKALRFKPSPMDHIEQDLAEIAAAWPGAERVQLLSGNPFVLPFDRLDAILDKVHEYLPNVRVMSCSARVTDMRNKTVEQLKAIASKGLTEVDVGVESGDDWTLERVRKGYRAADIVEQCRKLEDAGISYGVTFMGGIAGRSHSRDHALNSAQVFSELNPVQVGATGLVLFEGTELRAEAEAGAFDPLSEREMLEELRLFLANLDHDGILLAHHTVATSPRSGSFNENKRAILASLDDAIEHADMDALAAVRAAKRDL